MRARTALFLTMLGAGCASKEAEPCPATVDTDQAIAADAGVVTVGDASPSDACVAACGIMVHECPDIHPCGWRSGPCVTCRYLGRCN